MKMRSIVAALILLLAAPASAQESGKALVDAAKKEGVVVIYAGGHTREGIVEVANLFQRKYGIRVEFTRKGTGEVAKMVEAERQSGAFRGDVVSVADPGLLITWGKQGLLAVHRVPNLASIPKDLQDPSGWATPYSVSPLGILYNTRLVAAGDLPKRWSDFTNARWRGKIVHADPGYSGTSLTFVNGLIRAFGPKLYEQLGRNKPLIVQSALAVPQMVLSGEASLGVPGIESQVAVAKERGEPLGIAYPEDGVVVSYPQLAVLAKAPHPNAARLLLDFHLSDEMQQRFAETGARSVNPRIAAPKDTPPSDRLKFLHADVAWLALHRSEQIKQFEALALGK